MFKQASNVTIIEPIKKEKIKSCNSQKRVCAYCRVSTDSEEQKTSYNSQVKYYENFIKSHEDWTFAGIYADEGISGTSMKKRTRFREMINDALAGKIDMILCKSVSRFARNVVDILNVIEKLNLKGVPILFENENLNSLDDKQGTRLQILISASNAQDYSQSLSESVKWGLRRQIEQGNYPFSRCYGYRVKNKRVTIEEKEAEVVKFIFKSYLSGDSYRQIAQKLEERNICSPMGKSKWQSTAIEDILSNVRYKGDLHLQRTTTSDIKFRKQIKNETEKQYYITNHHKAIISKAEWERAKEEREKRRSLRGYSKSGKGTYSSKYPFSNKIFCLQCGSRFKRHGYETWVCINHKNGKDRCGQLPINEKNIENAFVEVLNEVVDNKDRFVEILANNIYYVIKENRKNIDEKLTKIFDKFDSGIFKQVCNKIQIDGDKVFFVLNNSLKIEKIIKKT